MSSTQVKKTADKKKVSKAEEVKAEVVKEVKVEVKEVKAEVSKQGKKSKAVEELSGKLWLTFAQELHSYLLRART